MPLITGDIAQAREAYARLEGRLASAERRASTAEAALGDLLATHQRLLDTTGVLQQRILDLEGINIELQRRLDQVTHFRADVGLVEFVTSVGLAVALGEASMPDRTVSGLSASIRTFLTPEGGVAGLRFPQPELGDLASGLTTTSFQLAKIPAPADVPAPRPLYTVVQDKQLIYSATRFAGMVAAGQLVTSASRLLADTGAWSFSFLVQQAGTIGSLEAMLADALPDRPAGAREALAQAAVALSALTERLMALSRPSAGDLLALSTAMDTTSRAARAFLP
jgi:hypothetical protein